MAGLNAAPLAVFALRVIVGGLLVVAGALKVGQFGFMASTIAGYRLLPAVLIAPLAVVLPYFEIALGAYLMLGLFTRAAALVATAQFTLFAAAIASVVVRGIPIACGCFGPGDTSRASWLDVGRDLLLVAAALIIALRPPGAFALDHRIGGSS